VKPWGHVYGCCLLTSSAFQCIEYLLRLTIAVLSPIALLVFLSYMDEGHSGKDVHLA
jgi:hypothetical protein